MTHPLITLAEKPMKAFAVIEEYESTGGIVFAKTAVEARRKGADEYADGEFSAVSCRRAPWADGYADSLIPAGLMIDHGWHFECSGCGSRIDEDHLWETQRLLDDVIGNEHSEVFCDAVCEAREMLDRAERKRLQTRWLRRFCKFVKAKFPDAKPEQTHAYASRRANGRLYIAQVAVSFEFPGRQHSLARLEWRERSSWEKTWPKPHFTCSNGDREAFEAYAALVGGSVQ